MNLSMGAAEFTPGFSGVRVDGFVVFCVVYCRLLIVPLSFWPLYYLFFDLRLLFISLEFSHFSCSITKFLFGF